MENRHLNIKEILSLYSDNEKKIILRLIAESYFTEKQLIRFSQTTFNITTLNSLNVNKVNAQKLLLTFSFLMNSKILEISNPSIDNLVKRLLKGSNEAVVEILCHNFLTKLFKNYYLVLPLFSDNPDGGLRVDPTNIPIEIKSRKPEIISKLSDFFSYFTDLIEKMNFPHNKTIYINIHFEKKLRAFDDKTLFEEKHDLRAFIEKLKTVKIPLYPMIFQAKRKSKNVNMNINITSANSLANSSFFMPKEFVDNSIFFTGYSSLFNGKFSNSILINLTCSSEVKKEISELIIKRCLKAKNIKTEPGIIVIHFDSLTNEHLIDFFIQTSRKFIYNKPNTMIIGVKDSINNGKIQMIGRILASGNKIKETLKNEFNIKLKFD